MARDGLLPCLLPFAESQRSLPLDPIQRTVNDLLIIFRSLRWFPISFIAFVVMMAAWLFLYFLRDEPITVLGRTINDLFVIIVLSLLTLVLLLLTGARKTEAIFVNEEAASLGGRYTAIRETSNPSQRS